MALSVSLLMRFECNVYEIVLPQYAIYYFGIIIPLISGKLPTYPNPAMSTFCPK